MKVYSIAMILVVVACLVGGKPLQAAKIGNTVKSGINRLADTVGMRHLTNFFVKPTDGGYSPFVKTIAAGALALSSSWSTMSLMGCSCVPRPDKTSLSWMEYENSPNFDPDRVPPGMEKDIDPKCLYEIIGTVMVVGFVALIIEGTGIYDFNIQSPGHYQPEGSHPTANFEGIEEQHLVRHNWRNHSIIVDNETYEGVLITYRDGVDTRTGLAFSPQASLVFSMRNREQGMLGFMAKDRSFQPPEEITIKHLDSETPNKVISLARVENVVLTELLASQELLLGEE